MPVEFFELQKRLKRLTAEGERLARMAPPPVPSWNDPEQQGRWIAAQAERNAAPLVTRDAMLSLLEEARKGAKRDRWILGFSAGSLLVSAAALIVALF
jgi:hypothetical protein